MEDENNQVRKSTGPKIAGIVAVTIIGTILVLAFAPEVVKRYNTAEPSAAVAELKADVKALEHKANVQESEIVELRRRIEDLDQRVFRFETQPMPTPEPPGMDRIDRIEQVAAEIKQTKAAIEALKEAVTNGKQASELSSVESSPTVILPGPIQLEPAFMDLRARLENLTQRHEQLYAWAKRATPAINDNISRGTEHEQRLDQINRRLGMITSLERAKPQYTTRPIVSPHCP